MKPPMTPKPTADLLRETKPTRFKKIMQAVPQSQRRHDYHHWDKLRHLKPPEDLTHEEWWLGLKITRGSSLRPIPLRDTGGQPFMFSMPDPVIEMLHRVDQNASGQIAISEEVTNPATRNRYVVSSLIEEAITSSQLEGAATTNRGNCSGAGLSW